MKAFLMAVSGVALLSGGFMLGGMYQQHEDTKYLRTTAIEYGCAAYDRKTGQWGWEKPILTVNDMEEHVQDALPKGSPPVGIQLPNKKPRK